MHTQNSKKIPQKQVVEQLKAEFDLKSTYLRRFCTEVGGKCDIAPLDYYNDLYYNDEAFMGGRKEVDFVNKEGVTEKSPMPFFYKIEEGIKIAYGGIEEVMQIGLFRDDIAVFPASYFRWAKQETLSDFYAIVIDLDGVSAADLYCLLKAEVKSLMPTYIVNSGGGVHLVYVFEKPIVAYKFRHQTIKQMIHAVCEVFRKKRYGYKIDPMSASLVHPYRVIGSKTKLGKTCVAFRVGQKWSVNKMLKKLGIQTDVFKDKATRQKIAQEKKAASDGEKKEKKVSMPCGHKNFYNFFVLQMTNVEEGHRYLALFALAVVAYKCRVKREEVEDLISALIDVYNQREHTDTVKEYELKKAMYGYSIKYVGVKAEQLEKWTGLTFPRNSVKRRPKGQRLKRNEHLKVARDIRNTKLTETKEILMRRCLQANPSATLVELMDELGWSKPTVIKYRRKILQR